LALNLNTISDLNECAELGNEFLVLGLAIENLQERAAIAIEQ